MVNVVKIVTDIENIYTYFEFNNYDKWDEFDNLLFVLTTQMGCKVLEKLEGIYSKHCILEKQGFIFKLMYHEDFGNCLCSRNKEDSTYYIVLERIAKEIISKI